MASCDPTAIDHNINFDFVVVLRERVSHVPLKLDNCEVQFKLVVAAWQVLLKERVRETANEAALIILHHLREVVLQELELEVSQVKPTVIVCGELVGSVDHDLVRVPMRHESVRHGPANLKDLLVRGDQFVELEGCVRTDRQVTYLALGWVHVDAFVVSESATRVNYSNHLIFVDLGRSLLL